MIDPQDSQEVEPGAEEVGAAEEARVAPPVMLPDLGAGVTLISNAAVQYMQQGRYDVARHLLKNLGEVVDLLPSETFEDRLLAAVMQFGTQIVPALLTRDKPAAKPAAAAPQPHHARGVVSYDELVALLAAMPREAIEVLLEQVARRRQSQGN